MKHGEERAQKAKVNDGESLKPDDLQKALDNRPNLYKIPSNLTEHLKFETQIIEWFEDFERKFSAFQKDYTLSFAKEPVLRKRILELLDETDANCGDYRVKSVVRGLKEKVEKVFAEDLAESKDSVVISRKQLQDLLIDMSHIPKRRLPLGKNAWLHEWNDVQQKLKELLEAKT
jgi:hypothetical protein